MLQVYSGKIPWVKGKLLSREQVSENLLTLKFSVDDAAFVEHVPGQHYDLRLTAPGDYVAERSYSIANSPDEKGVVELGIQLIPDGEVSPYLWSIQKDAMIEMRGPIGGHFVWDASMSETLILIGGGSGMVPLMSMVRHYAYMKRGGSMAGVSLVCRKIFVIISARTVATIPYYSELTRLAQEFPEIVVAITVTQDPPADWKGYTSRIDMTMIQKVVGDSPLPATRIYSCGRNGFVDAAVSALISVGYTTDIIKTERFG